MESLLPCLAFATTASAAGGCFFTQDINSRPVARIDVEADTGPLRVNRTYTLTAKASVDAEDGHDLDYRWELRHCLGEQECPGEQAFDPTVGMTRPLRFVVPDSDPAVLSHETIWVTLIVTDSHQARGTTTVPFRPVNQPPSVLKPAAAEGSLINEDRSFSLAREFTFVTDATDGDGEPLTLSWSVDPPPGGTFPPPPVDIAGHSEYRFAPDVRGMWYLSVTADDGVEKITSDRLEVFAEVDRPPCIRQVDPAAPADATVILARDGGLAHFRVESVYDDFDPYPFPVPSDALSGRAHFRWWLGTGDAALAEAVGQVASDFTFDPGVWARGVRLRLAVDALDRRLEQGVDEKEPTCVRQHIWNLEVR